jgi:CheY-like chemotaxis protein
MTPKRVLVVDDEKLIRWALCEALRERYVVYTAASADEALNLMGVAPVDAVITDLKMPGMSGVEFVELVRRRHPGVRLFALSAYATDVVVRHLLSRGVLECVAKPFEVGEVVRMLDRHLGDPAPVAAPA